MGFYRDIVLPKLCDLTMRRKDLLPYRARVIGAAEGRVLEIGAGSGLNLKLYGAGVTEVLALEPDPELLTMAEKNAKEAPRPVVFMEASAEDIPLDGGSVDTVVTTWTLCTIPNSLRALQEMKRVLKHQGSLLFIEHGQSLEQPVRKWQNRVDPVWSRISGGCHLNRPIRSLIEQAGFRIERLEHEYLPGPKMMGFLYEGRALPR
jgi:ubiquinone/menaquinone biosynthesis C-methylase UbiE